MFTNLFRAKVSTHTLTIAIVVLAFMAHRFFADPQAEAWLNSHWVLRDLGETIGAALAVFGVYKQPTSPVA